MRRSDTDHYIISLKGGGGGGAAAAAAAGAGGGGGGGGGEVKPSTPFTQAVRDLMGLPGEKGGKET